MSTYYLTLAACIWIGGSSLAMSVLVVTALRSSPAAELRVRQRVWSIIVGSILIGIFFSILHVLHWS